MSNAILAKARATLAVGVVVMPLAWATEWLAATRSLVSLEEFVAAELTVALMLVFLTPRQRETNRLDVALALATAVVGGITVFWIDTFLLQLFFGGPFLVTLSGALVLLSLLGCYRVAGAPMTILVSGFIAFGVLAQSLPPPINAPSISLQTYTIYLAFGGDALIGQALKIVSVVVVVFILFGRLFEMIGGTAFFVQIARQASGSGPGGPVKIAVVASALFGSISGSTTANVVSSGNFSIPMMTRIGLRPHQAAAVEAVASTGGQLMPPVMGIAAFLMVEIAGLPYREVIAAAALPGLLFFVSVFFQADGMAVRMNLPSERPERPDWRALAWKGARLAIPTGLLVGTLIQMPYAPGHAAVVGGLACLVLALLSRPTAAAFIKNVFHAVRQAGDTAARIVVTGAVIGIMLGVVNATGLGVAAALGIERMTDGGLALALVAAACASFFLGLGLATTAVYAVVGTLIAPSLITLGLPVISAHLFVFYSAMLSMITPPVAIACLAASGLAHASFWSTSMTAVRIGWSLFLLPFLFVMNPGLLLLGSLGEIVTAALCCFAGVAALSWVLGRLPLPRRDWGIAALLFVTGVTALLPIVPMPIRLLMVGVICITMVGKSRWKQRLQEPTGP